jgi:hypothetical protein
LAASPAKPGGLSFFSRDHQIVAAYLAGVASANSDPNLAAPLGQGMEDRILSAYAFLAKHFRPGDRIYIFGFSRGALQARSLAGLVSYAGIPTCSQQDLGDQLALGNRIIELLKKKQDDDYYTKWTAWSLEKEPPLSDELLNLGISVVSAEVSFLGIWDTVPGSSLKSFGTCKEERGFIKRFCWWLLPGVDSGERYKTGSYPPMRNIAHAVSLDEKRSKFRPLLLCKPIDPIFTNQQEVWFPGAHSDVGGGYGNHELPNISLAWMVELLSEVYEFDPKPTFVGCPKGLAHWSMGDFPGNLGSQCVDRVPPSDAIIHESVDDRARASPVPILWKKKRVFREYPAQCRSSSTERASG